MACAGVRRWFGRLLRRPFGTGAALPPMPGRHDAPLVCRYEVFKVPGAPEKEAGAPPCDVATAGDKK